MAAAKVQPKEISERINSQKQMTYKYHPVFRYHWASNTPLLTLPLIALINNSHAGTQGKSTFEEYRPSCTTCSREGGCELTPGTKSQMLKGIHDGQCKA